MNTTDQSRIKSGLPGADAKVKQRNDIIAFSAQLSYNAEVSPGSTIIFDQVLINEGNLYVNTSGQFACLDNFVFVFMWSLKPHSSSSGRGLASLSRRGVDIKYGPQNSLFELSDGRNGNSQMSVVTQCVADPISAFTVTSAISPAPTYENTYSAFSGYRLASLESAVGFTAELRSDIDLIPGGRVIFGNVISNFGGHYSSLHGFFRCPDNGVYSFALPTHFPEGTEQWSVSNLMFDGSILLHGPITYNASADIDSGSSSMSILHECEAGKDLYVEAANAYTFPYNSYGAGLTSFSGYQICSDDCADLVAFSAILTQNVTNSLQDIPFEDVRINLGNAYNPSDGVFTCPDESLYLFIWSGTGSVGWIGADLYFDSVTTGRLYTTFTGDYGDQYGTSGTSSQSIIIRCSLGSTVSIRGGGITSSDFILADFSNFSGYHSLDNRFFL